MDYKDVEKIISSNFIVEKEILGENLFSKVVEGAVLGERYDVAPRFGHAMDIVSVVEAVKLAAEFTLAVYGVFKLQKELFDKKSKEVTIIIKDDKYKDIEENILNDICDEVSKGKFS
ncbi:hypothetical protein [Roseibium polysiphoniae]|uniref:Uncharacterized protein n=1 Tax=Roseibium polysiphoniae TaxID=2571221 RepID=A0ABR9C738_9HYPH|nr:hypothetical protein [Roseibium polysiphoniae]MBD8875423.1 hypothetical protein [Roseibium polysiphoniae]